MSLRIFHAELEAVAQKIGQWPESYPQFRAEFRRAILKRFPYQLIYKIEPDRIRILVIRHHKRSSDFGLDR